MKTTISTQRRRGAEARKAIKRIKPQPLSDIALHLKFAKCVTALGELTDAMEEISRAMVANEKYNRLPLRLCASAVKNNGGRAAT